EAWSVGGAVSVVSGVYKTNFDLADRITKICLSTPPAKPFWEEYPAFGNASLALTLDVRKFAVDNNIATIEMSGKDIEVTQTPRDPRLSGSILVQQGSFRVPGTRASFSNTHGSVDFSENEHASNPTLGVTSEANFRDLSGQEHVITMRIDGTLERPEWDLTTSTGYNKSQTLSLLVLGRNQEQLRRSLGDQSLGTDPTHVDPTTNPSAGFADQIVKDLAGDWVSGLIGGSLERLTGLDVLRFDIGFGSVGIHFEKKVLENARVLGDFETTIRGSTSNLRAEFLTPFSTFVIQGGLLNKNFNDPAEQDIQDLNLKLTYRLFIP
ncbi:MAG: translocation/assembly module TamB domain-containing protein, partial [Proteobacteria bacterium]|nr:translocation/assembly module TamB domain-containing protein [Pseudomonadota bacterium]